MVIARLLIHMWAMERASSSFAVWIWCLDGFFVQQEFGRGFGVKLSVVGTGVTGCIRVVDVYDKMYIVHASGTN